MFIHCPNEAFILTLRFQVFGVAPPQTLYHTRHAPSASVQVGYKTPRTRSAKPSPTRDSLSSPPLSPRNPNQSSYKPKSKKNERPSTAESSKQLLPKGRGSNDYDDPSPDSSAPRAQRGSLVYSHYQHSLNSLNDILDRVCPSYTLTPSIRTSPFPAITPL